MTWQYLFWLLLRRNSNKLTEMYHLLANIFVLKSIKLTLFHHYNLCGKITRRWHFCGFSFFLNSNRQIDWTISCKKYGAWNIFLFTGDLQSLILVYLMKQTNANNERYLIWVLCSFCWSWSWSFIVTTSSVHVLPHCQLQFCQYLDRELKTGKFWVLDSMATVCPPS